MNRLIILFFFLLVMNGWADGQTCCTAGAPLTSTLDINGKNGKQLTLGLDYEFNSVNRLVDQETRVENDPRTRSGQSLLLRSDYALSERWAFSAMIPWVSQKRSTVSASENANGVGDLTLLSQYTQSLSDRSSFRFVAGVKLPTGNVSMQSDRGITLSPDMQSGSGTIDFIGRVAWTQNGLWLPNLNLQSAVAYRHNTTNEHFGGENGRGGRVFKFGNETSWTTTINYSMVAGRFFLVPDAGFQIRRVAPNEESRNDAPNSGGYWFQIPFGLQIQTVDLLSFRLYANIPIKENLNGFQITTDYRVGFQFRAPININSKITPPDPIN